MQKASLARALSAPWSWRVQCGAASGSRAGGTFLSTQLRPLEEAQRARTQILKGSPVKITYVPEEPPQLPIHLQADDAGRRTRSA